MIAFPPEYAELAVTSNFTFLTGASHPEELVATAAELGHTAIAVTDTNTLAGIIRAHVAARESQITLVVGSRLVLADGVSVFVYPTSRTAYSGLCRLLTLGKRRAPKGECHLTLTDLFEHSDGLLVAVLPSLALPTDFAKALSSIHEVFDDDRLSLVVSRRFGASDDERLEQLSAISRQTRVPLLATSDALYHTPQRRPLQDVLTCIRHGCTIEQAGFRLAANAERHLKTPAEMQRLFAPYPEAIARTVEVARRAGAFSLDELRYEYPVEPCPPGRSPIEHLRREAFVGAGRRYPQGVPTKVHNALTHELALIEELRYEPYFLTCYEIVQFARSRGILCQGRGGAANSAVCYCLGITEVDPDRHQLLFERFISRERGEPPDIDIDFEHERREEVIQHIYEKYGRERAALTAEVICYRPRSAVREVGKAMGLSLDCVDMLAKGLSGWGEKPSEERVREVGLDPADATIRHVLTLTAELVGFPRHLSQHVGGFVITRGPLCELVPIENAAMEDRTVIEWDKDDIDAMGMLKVDCLGLGMLTCLRKAIELANSDGRTCPDMRGIIHGCAEDTGVYDMICHADTVGVFQIESRAQMSMLPRLRPRTYYDLVIEVAIVRPGPIQGDMVHPYLRRRSGEEPVSYPDPAIEHVLGRTLGVPLFQEQAMQLAIVAAGFTPDEADRLRRAMAAWKRKGNTIVLFGEKLIEGMVARGYPRDFAERCFNQLKGFSEYGFPESHAASFALLVYASAWLKRYRPAAFAAALVNSQPMGFYQPAQIIRDAREHGVEIREVDVNASQWDCTLEQNPPQPTSSDPDSCANHDSSNWGCNGPAIRLGMRLVKSLKQTDADRIARAVQSSGPFSSVDALWRASGVSVASLRALARADAFGSMGLDRQAALWQIRPLRDDVLPLFECHERADQDEVGGLPAVPDAARVLHDYASTGLSLKAHPVAFIRKELDSRGVVPARELRSPDSCPQGKRLSVAGLVLSRQRPETASGVVFITLEDETGIANLIVWPKVFDRCRRDARLSTILLAHGRIQREGEVVHLHADTLESLDAMTPSLRTKSRDFH